MSNSTEMDDWDDPPVKVTILDRETGRTHTDADFGAKWWAEGNGHCDCNRWPYDLYDAAYGDSGHPPCGKTRFVIIAIEGGGDPADLNRGYTEEPN